MRRENGALKGCDGAMMRTRWKITICLIAVSVLTRTAAAQVTVPNLVGLPLQSAETVLQRAGLAVGTCMYGSSADMKIEIIYRQNPAAGTSVASGTAVAVVIAKVPSPAKKDPVWPWGTNPADHSNVMSFCDAQQALMDNPAVIGLIPDEYQGLLTALGPTTGDINGTSYVVLKNTYPDGDVSFELNGNGKIDCQTELRLVGDILANPNFNVPAHGAYPGLTYAKVLRAVNVDYEQLEQDVGSFWAWLGSIGNGLQQVLIGHMMVGDGDAILSDYHDEGDPPVPRPNRIDCSGSAGFVKAAMFLLGNTGYIANPAIDLAAYTRMPQFFAMEGDADGDGASNTCEYRYANDNDVFPALTAEQRSGKYAEFALDPSKTPPSCYCSYSCVSLVNQSHDRWYEIGDTMTLFVDVFLGGGQGVYAWEKDGALLPGATTDTYIKEDLTLADSGLYRCTASNLAGSAKVDETAENSVSATMTIYVVPEGSLPLTPPATMVLLIIAVSGGAGLAVRRRYR